MGAVQPTAKPVVKVGSPSRGVRLLATIESQEVHDQSGGVQLRPREARGRVAGCDPPSAKKRAKIARGKCTLRRDKTVKCDIRLAGSARVQHARWRLGFRVQLTRVLKSSSLLVQSRGAILSDMDDYRSTAGKFKGLLAWSNSLASWVAVCVCVSFSSQQNQ